MILQPGSLIPQADRTHPGRTRFYRSDAGRRHDSRD